MVLSPSYLRGCNVVRSHFSEGRIKIRKERASRLVMGIHLQLVLPDHCPSGVVFRKREREREKIVIILCIETTLSSEQLLFLCFGPFTEGL